MTSILLRLPRCFFLTKKKNFLLEEQCKCTHSPLKRLASFEVVADKPESSCTCGNAVSG